MRLTALVVALTLVFAAPAAAAPSLLHVGDSLAVGSDAPLRQLLPGWSVTTDALKNRPTSAGVAIIGRRPSLPGALVVELGTNDSPDRSAQFAGYVRHVLDLAGADRCVVWVNIHRPPYNGVSYAGFNRALDQIAATSANLAVVDWNGMVNGGQAQIAGDGVHATPAGYRVRAAAIAQALTGCTTQRAAGKGASHTIRPAPRRHANPAPRPRAQPKPAAPAKTPIRVYTPTTATAAAAPAAARGSGSGGAAPWIAGGIAAALLLAGGGYVLARRRG